MVHTMRIEFKHRIFNPLSGLPGFSVLGSVVFDMEKDGWRLVSIVPNHQFESVAVFERLVIEEPVRPVESGEEVPKEGGYI